MNLHEKHSDRVETVTFDGDIADPKQIVYLVLVDGKEVWRRLAPKGTRQKQRMIFARQQSEEAIRLAKEGV